MSKRLTAGTVGWLLGWLVLLAVLVGLLTAVRPRLVARFDRPEIRADWQRWKKQAEQQSVQGKGPVQRRPPRSEEHPALILMRDHFPVVVSSALVLGSCLYAFLAIAMRGAWSRHQTPLGERRRGLPASDRAATPP